MRELLEGLADGPRDDAELGLEIRSLEEAQQTEEDVDAVERPIEHLHLDHGVELAQHVHDVLLELASIVSELQEPRAPRVLGVEVDVEARFRVEGSHLRNLPQPHAHAAHVQPDGQHLDVVPRADEVIHGMARLERRADELGELGEHSRENKEAEDGLKEAPEVVIVDLRLVVRVVVVRLRRGAVRTVFDLDVAALRKVKVDDQVAEVPQLAVVRQHLHLQVLGVLVDEKAVFEVLDQLIERVLAQINVNHHREAGLAPFQGGRVEPVRHAPDVEFAVFVKLEAWVAGVGAALRVGLRAAAHFVLCLGIVKPGGGDEHWVDTVRVHVALIDHRAHLAAEAPVRAAVPKLSLARLVARSRLVQENAADDDVLGRHVSFPHRRVQGHGGRGVGGLGHGHSLHRERDVVLHEVAAAVGPVAGGAIVREEHRLVAPRVLADAEVAPFLYFRRRGRDWSARGDWVARRRRGGDIECAPAVFVVAAL